MKRPMAYLSYRLEWDDGAHVIEWRGADGDASMRVPIDTSALRIYTLKSVIHWPEGGVQAVPVKNRFGDDCPTITLNLEEESP
jgi:hypothetical protein